MLLNSKTFILSQVRQIQSRFVFGWFHHSSAASSQAKDLLNKGWFSNRYGQPSNTIIHLPQTILSKSISWERRSICSLGKIIITFQLYQAKLLLGNFRLLSKMLATLVFVGSNSICDTFRNHHICVAFRRFDWWYIGLTTLIYCSMILSKLRPTLFISRLIRRIYECHHQYLQKAWYPSINVYPQGKSLQQWRHVHCGSW